jgi:BlaI family penicillinase repressor
VPDGDKSLTAAEWELMECLWERAPRTGREAVDQLQQRVGWSRSTTLTMLRRMTEKGLIACEREGEVLRYSPLIRREDAVRRETRSFLDRVYQGSVGLMLNAMARERKLSRREIEELYEILRRAEEEEP